MLLKMRTDKIRAALAVFVVMAISILGAGQAYAQVSGASLSGTVKDSSGAVILNAQVSVTDVATGVIRNVTTDSSGLYSAPNLLPGNYEVSVTAPGFSTQMRKGITLTVGAQQALDITMQVGQVSQTVEVTEEAPTVELTSSTLSGEVNATTVRELPLNGRSWTDLANLQPGVVTAESHASGDPNRGFGAQISISGGRPQQNNYRLDGVSINDYANGGPGSVLGGNLGVDAIQEFSVLTSTYSAEYGKTSGGVINAITRSGTNQIHGSAYEFLRNSALDARNFFDGPTIPPFKRNQFGGAMGGPIRKDHTFFFADYESVRQSLGTTTLDQVLSPAARTGNLSTGTVTVDPKVTEFLALEPRPNAGLNGVGDTGNYRFIGQQIVNENFVTGRVDQNISGKDKLFGTYSFDDSPLTQPDPLGNFLQRAIARRQIAALEESHIFSPSFINTLRLGYNRDHATSAAGIQNLNPAAGNPDLAWSPTLASAVRTNIGGLTQIGPGAAPPQFQFVWNSYQLYDDAFLSKGLHSLKFGGGFENDQLNQVTRTADFIGTYSFSSLANFLQNIPSRVRGVLPTTLAPRYMRTSIFGAYLQDDWRARPNLTLNLGLRYEINTVISETAGRLTKLVPITAFPQTLGGPYYRNPTLHNFEPRIGFSWDPFKKGKTAVRGGFGMFDVLPLLYSTITLNGRGAPFFAISSLSNTAGQLNGQFPNGGINVVSAGKPALENAYVEPQPHRDYVMQWNLNVQQEIVPNLTVMVGYVGSHGVHQLFRADDSNMVLPTLTSAGYLWPSPVGSGTVLNPNVGAIRFVDWGGDSFYHALQVGVQKNMSHGLQVRGSFTWSKSIDDNSGAIAGDTLANGISSLDWFDLSLDRGVSDFNIGRVLVINGTWMIPASKATGAVGWVTNGWQLGGILKANDGVPITPLFGNTGDPLGKKSTDPYDYPNRITGGDCASLVNPRNVKNYVKTQCFVVPTAPTPAFYAANCDPSHAFPACFNLRGNAGRNIIVGPGLVNLDFSLFKNNYVKRISENFNAQFRMEVFNILNHANFAIPPLGNDQILLPNGGLNPSAGQLTSTSTSSRQIQFAIKMMW
ncbi:MAG: TonB-dependent receptor [Acidobacteriia bacterium]|nr:TonB-dependent receptor [Terriglobia bacterium]